MTPTRTTPKRRPTGRLFLLATLLLLTAGTSHAQFSLPGINLNLPTDSSYTTCLEQGDPQRCLQQHLPAQETPEAIEADQGFIDQVEALTADAYIGFDLPFLVDEFSSVPNIRLGHAGAYQACLEEGPLNSCSRNFIIERPALPDSQGAEASAAVEAAWEKFNRNVREDLHEALNTGEPCYAPIPSCTLTFFGIAQAPPLPRPDCAIRKLATAYPKAIYDHYPVYVAEVLEAMATHLPTALVYGFDQRNANPLVGSLVAPLFKPDAALEFDLSTLPFPIEDLQNMDIGSLSSEARALIYYHEPYLAQIGIHINAPVLPHETLGAGPGVTEWEAAKRDFGPGSAIEQEYKGYAFLYQLTAPARTHIFGQGNLNIVDFYKPGIQARCIEGLKIPGLNFPVPVPGHFPIFEDRTIAIGEGMFIPATDGQLIGFETP